MYSVVLIMIATANLYFRYLNLHYDFPLCVTNDIIYSIETHNADAGIVILYNVHVQNTKNPNQYMYVHCK